MGGQRGRLIFPEEKREAVELIHEAVKAGARKKRACNVLGISIKSIQRWEKECFQDRRKGSIKTVPRKLSDEERDIVKDIACKPEYKDLNPYQIVALLAENGEYIASERTFYRILKKNGLLHHRGNTSPRAKKIRPDELVATGPDQIWSWDITWLRTEVRGLFFYAYVIKDIWTRDIIGWEIHDRESDEIAAAMFKRLKLKYDMNGIFLRSDNGNPMKGATMLATLYSLGVIPSYSRPRVSNDNPFIESFFKTLKYMPGYPGHFKTIQYSRTWMAEFVNWYNTKHLHSGIGYVTPAQRRSGKYIEIFNKRNATITNAMMKKPERWVNKQRIWNCEDKVYLNRRADNKEIRLKKIA